MIRCAGLICDETQDFANSDMICELIDEQDSGMESLGASKDDTPERKPDDTLASSPIDTICVSGECAKEYDDEPEETLAERLWGLTEMFPERCRNNAYCLTMNIKNMATRAYGLSRSVVWIVASSSVILFAPVIFEVERAQMDEMQKSQQKQVLLGTNAALGAAPPMPRM